jgi:hypothetical protein
MPAHVAQQRADALPALAIARLVLGGGAFGGEPTLLGFLRVAGFAFLANAIALGGDPRRKLGHELPGRSALDQATQVGERVAYALGLQPSGEFVEEDLMLASQVAQQALRRIALLRQQPGREDQCFTTTCGR